jgi:short-subunit dehydrogenase
VRLDGRVALVTGASSGIGAATACALSNNGARLLVHGRDEARTSAVARRSGGVPLLCDLASPGGVRDLTAASVGVHGRVDLLVANAAVGLRRPFTEVDPAELDRVLSLDLTVPLQLVRGLLPSMVRRGEGHVVLVGSVAGRTGVAGEAVYSAAKAGLDVFSESLRCELAGTGVGVTVVVPGVVETPFVARRRAPARRVPRPVSAERVAAAIVRAVADDRPEVWIPAWLRVAAVVRGVAPGTFRRLSARLGEQVRIRADDRRTR